MNWFALVLFALTGFLGNYAPADLVKVAPGKQVREIIVEDLNNLLKAAEKENINLKIISAYRSYNYQKWLYEKGNPNYVAKPGYSEHQLGTTIDFGNNSPCDLKSCFAYTKAGFWLIQNAYKYGFLMSYPPGNPYYGFEPWHYRWHE